MSFYDLENYTKEDIQYLIDFGVEESVHLDYKASGALAKTDSKKKEISKKFSQAFIIAFIDGKKVNTNEAIRIYKEKKQK